MSVRGLIDYFVVCGLNANEDFATELEIESGAFHRNPLRRPYRAHVLRHFPEECTASGPFDSNGIVMFCFPRGLRFKRESEDRRVKFHSFVMTKEDGTRTYGANLTFYDTVTDSKIVGAIQVLQAMYKQQSVCDDSPRSSSLVSPRSTSPVCYVDLQNEAIYAPKSICLLSSIPAVACFEQYLRQLFTLARQSDIPLPLECFIANLLFEVPLPPPGYQLTFQGSDSILLNMPSAMNLPLFQYSIRRLTALFRADVIVDLLSCMAVERQIVIFADDYELLVLVCECITALLYPFVWSHVYVPILPSTLLHFLDAPVPFVMGLHSEMYAELQSKKGCIVDIRGGTLTVVDGDEIPAFPFRDLLIQRLNHLVETAAQESSGCANALASVNPRVMAAVSSGIVLPALPNNPGTAADYKFSENVRALFMDVWTELLKDCDKFVIMPDDPAVFLEGNSDEDYLFDKVAFLQQQPRTLHTFLHAFLDTQMFAAYVDKKICNLIRQCGPTDLFETRIQQRGTFVHNLFDVTSPPPPPLILPTEVDQNKSFVACAPHPIMPSDVTQAQAQAE